ncbi:MAG: T9SS type A sorting domain-containing protein [Flavobacteriaceae bacterium]|nr:T9SS type A sorting domain-containing protein [Flavobacteriaceae bacterium]
MKKYILIIVLFCSFSVINAQTVKIGSTSYSTITEAITAASDGDIIEITGVHTEAITFGKSITLRGTDPTTDIIQEAESPSTSGSGVGVINVIREGDNDVLTVTIENLGVRNGNSASNGGGINIDKVTGKLTLNNLIIENNHSAKNGGGLGVAGSIADITNCTIKNNSSSLDGGSIIFAPNNGANVNSVINVRQCLIDSNTGRNGGGIYINGNPNFGNDYLIDVVLENTTVSNNNATSASGGNGGGAIFSAGRPWTADTSVGNTTLKLIHATFYGNSHSAKNKSGIQFGSAKATNFSAYNSIIVAKDDLNTKALNFANSNTTDVVNCILGGLNGAPAAIVDDTNKNNSKGKTATFAGISALTDEGGATQVFAFAEGSNSDDYCTAATGITLPTVDQRGAMREGTPDAGAFEFGGTLSTHNFIDDSRLSVYPNPASYSIQLKGVNNIKKIRVYSILGALEMEIENTDFFLVNTLKKGVYFIKVDAEEGSCTKKFVVN